MGVSLCPFWRVSLPFSFFKPVPAKIHMVTKLAAARKSLCVCSVLAKIHMVTKPALTVDVIPLSSVLAKIHMVTKRLLLPIE